MNRKNLCDYVIEYIWSLDLKDLSQLTRYKIAEKFKINESYLSRKFKKDTKMLLSKFIQTVKIKRAENILNTSCNLTIRDISKQIGILNVDQFRKYFKETNGINPDKYRKLHKR